MIKIGDEKKKRKTCHKLHYKNTKCTKNSQRFKSPIYDLVGSGVEKTWLKINRRKVKRMNRNIKASFRLTTTGGC